MKFWCPRSSIAIIASAAIRRLAKATNLTHREFIYRQAFELGRHVIGYEVQKVLAAVDQFERRNRDDQTYRSGCLVSAKGGCWRFTAGRLILGSMALSVSGYFDRREQVWNEPIYRNVWGLLNEFGDAELAGMIAPRFLYVEQDVEIPEVPGPPKAERNIAAPGVIRRPDPHRFPLEIERAEWRWSQLSHSANPSRPAAFTTAGSQETAPGSA